MRDLVAILGIPVDRLDNAAALERIEEFVRSRRFHQVATANTDFLVQALGDRELREALVVADLVVPDGMPLVAASRWMGSPLPERVAGSDLVPALAKLAAEKGYSIFMLGARPEVASRARKRLESENSGLRIVGCVSPPVAPIEQMDNESLLAQIEEADPDILLVAFGNPKQEKWIYRHRKRLAVPVCIGVGATFDFLAGEARRAPVWMRRTGLEWFHRLAHDPRRLWRRYVKDFFLFGWHIIAQLRLMRRSGPYGRSSVTESESGDWTILVVSGSLDVAAMRDLRIRADDVLERSGLIVDLIQTTNVDSAAMGGLLNLAKRARIAGNEVRLTARGRILKALHAARVQAFMPIFQTSEDALRKEADDLRVQRALAKGEQT